MQREHGAEQEELQALTRPLSPQVIPFSVPRTQYAFFHLYQGTLFADGGATLLEKLYVCWDSDVGCGGNGVEEGAGGSRALGGELQAWAALVPLAHCVTLSSKSPNEALPLGCTCSGVVLLGTEYFFGSNLSL